VFFIVFSEELVLECSPISITLWLNLLHPLIC